MILGPDGRPAPGQQARRCMVWCRFVVKVTEANVQYFSGLFHDLDPTLPLPAVGMQLPLEGFLVLSTAGGKVTSSPVLFGPAGVNLEHPGLLGAIAGHQPMNSHAARIAQKELGVPVDSILWPEDGLQPAATQTQTQTDKGE